MKTFICTNCTKEFGAYRKNSKHVFCTQDCYHAWEVNNPNKGRYIKGDKRTKNYGDKNPMWKGKEVGYAALHIWIHLRLPKTKLCQACHKVPPHDLANISQEYKRDITDWEWLCRACHMKKDGRMKKLRENAIENLKYLVRGEKGRYVKMANRDVKLPLVISCFECRGYKELIKDCPTCEGKGYIPQIHETERPII